MPTPPITSPPRAFLENFAWRHVKPVVITCFLMSLLFLLTWTGSYFSMLARLLFIGFVGVLVFRTLERRPRRLPRWMARWVLQVVGVAIVMPIAAALAYKFATMHDAVPWYKNSERLSGFGMITFFSLLIGPWMAMSALYREISGAAQRQALAFELERSALENKALDARLRLLQAQVEPHFLFNTLANVRELVDSGSPQASTVLDHLIAYLRAAVPRLHEPVTTLGDELQLVRAYLGVMHMRMPDRLQFTLDVDDAAMDLRCPPTTLLTLVENAVRHGIDPSEEGGRIEVRVQVVDGRCRASVSDTGVGLQLTGGSLGTGLDTLRERLQLVFGGDARLQVTALQPHGVRAEVDFPAQRGDA